MHTQRATTENTRPNVIPGIHELLLTAMYYICIYDSITATHLKVGIDSSGPVLVLLQSSTGAEVIRFPPPRTSQRLRGL